MPDRRNDLFSKVLDLILSSMHWFDHYFTQRTLIDERTPLMVAARNASKKMVSFLLSFDASPDKTSSDGSTAFSCAIKSKCITTISLLAPMRIPQVLYINWIQSHQWFIGAIAWTKLIPAGNSVSAHRPGVGTTQYICVDQKIFSSFAFSVFFLFREKYIFLLQINSSFFFPSNISSSFPSLFFFSSERNIYMPPFPSSPPHLSLPWSIGWVAILFVCLFGCCPVFLLHFNSLLCKNIFSVSKYFPPFPFPFFFSSATNIFFFSNYFPPFLSQFFFSSSKKYSPSPNTFLLSPLRFSSLLNCRTFLCRLAHLWVDFRVIFVYLLVNFSSISNYVMWTLSILTAGDNASKQIL